MVWMNCMGIVRRDHKTLGQCDKVILCIHAEYRTDTEQRISKERRCSTLFCCTSDFFVIQNAVNGNRLFAVCAKQSVKRSTGTLEIIQTCSREKFLVCSPESSLLTIVEEEVVTQNFLFFDTGIL